VRDTTIASNYAETLLELARRDGDPEAWGALLGELATAVESDSTLRLFLASPQIDVTEKNAVLAKALSDHLPPVFVRFVEALVRHRRQTLIPEIAHEYTRLLDEMENRVRARVTVARPLSNAETKALQPSLTRAIGGGRTVIPEIRIHPPILGGMIVHIGDGVADGSVRTRLARLRRMLGAGRASAEAVPGL
jgi:F-type H+-transporting ATPase subunit delta